MTGNGRNRLRLEGKATKEKNMREGKVEPSAPAKRMGHT